MKPEVFILDTNIWVSYLLSKKYHHLVHLITKNELKIVTCKNLITEFEQVLQRNKFKALIKSHEINEAVKLHLKLCQFIEVHSKTEKLSDRKDNFLLDLYKKANATYIVTGDKQFIQEATGLGFKVITLAQFEKLVKDE